MTTTYLFILCSLLACSYAQILSFPLMRRMNLPPSTLDHLTKRATVYDSPLVYMYGAVNTTLEYFMAIEIGSQKQLFTVQIDTGSTSTAIPGLGCMLTNSSGLETGQQCTSVDPSYDYLQSDTARLVLCGAGQKCSTCSAIKNECIFKVKYGDGSTISGVLIRDMITIGGKSIEIEFGSILQQSKQFVRPKVDGIMGMAYKTLHGNGGDAIFDKLAKEHEVANVFSMCLGYHGGMLVLGGYDTKFHAAPPVWTPITQETYYVIKTNDIYVGDFSLKLANYPVIQNNTIVDSGTTLLLVPQVVLDQLRDTFQRVYPRLPGIGGSQTIFNGYCLLGEDIIKDYPDIQFDFPGAGRVTLKPEHYFLSLATPSKQAEKCLGIGVGSYSGIILGDIFMQAFNVIFDRQNKQMGFAPVKDCATYNVNMELTSGTKQNMTTNDEFDPLVVRIKYDDQHATAAVGYIIEWRVLNGTAQLVNPRSSSGVNGVSQNVIASIGEGMDSRCLIRRVTNKHLQAQALSKQ
jgi:hypothetical protein